MWKPNQMMVALYMYMRNVVRTNVLAYVMPVSRGCVYVDMCADLFHYGHVRLLKSAKDIAAGRRLVVGIHSDDTIRSYKRSPIMTMGERIEVVASCKYVDEVIPDAPLHITGSFMDDNNIDLVLHAHTPDDDLKYKRMYAAPCALKKFLRLEYTDTISTTCIIERCQQKRADAT